MIPMAISIIMEFQISAVELSACNGESSGIRFRTNSPSPRGIDAKNADPHARWLLETRGR